MRTALIVEDQSDSQQWLQVVLAEAFPAIQSSVAGSLAQAAAILSDRQFDLALIDLGLPDGNGSQLIGEIAQRSPQTLRIVATIFDDDEHLLPALRAGAQGYLLKQQGKAKLVALLQGIAEGQPPLSPAIARRILESFHTSQSPHDLSARECEVLGLIARGYRNTEAAEQLNLSPHTVHSHIKTIYQKLNVSSRVEAAMEAKRRGIIGTDQ